MARFGLVAQMIEVVGIHGIAQQQSGRYQLLADWLPSLHDGMVRAESRLRPELDIVFYGDLFLRRSGSKGPAGPVDLADLDADEVEFLSEVEAEVAQDVPPEAVKGLRELPTPVARLVAWLDRRFDVAQRAMFIGDLVQVRRFQRDDEFAAQVVERAAEVLAERPRVLIGHSLGSVVAHHVLHSISGHGVQTLITLGSPLALRGVRERLRHQGLPPGVRNWVNVLDPSDAVACAGGLGRCWPEVDDRTVDNGNQPHSVARYLGKAATGEAVAQGLS